MTAQLFIQDRGNDLYQRDLAERLVGVLGFDAAVDACRNNGWEGVLTVLCGTAPRTEGAAHLGHH